MNGYTLPPEVPGLVAALAVGLVIGLERGWQGRDLPEGGRVAGLRTFALTGLLGGVMGHLMPAFGAWPLVGALIGLSLLLTASYLRAVKLSGDLSATTAVAMLLTLALGAYASHGNVELALTAAVVASALLALKPTLHGWLRLIEHRELAAALQLLVLSVVILPYLPDDGLGPYGALNPYQLWWAVILISSLSLAGHVAMRLTGSHRGLFWTGILGGLASSTAATLTLSRYVRLHPPLRDAALAGMLAASAVMFWRMTVLIGVMAPALLLRFGVPLLLTGMVMMALALRCWRQRDQADPAAAGETPQPMAPFDLGTALGFAAFLAVMAVLVPAAKEWLGNSGLYALSAVSGLADVDAILISLARLHEAGGATSVAAIVALGLATLSNMVSKAAIAWTAGGAAVGRPVVINYALAMLAAVALTALMIALS